MKKKECAKNLTFDTPSFASPFGPFRPRFQPLIRVIKIQVVDCQRFKGTAKIRSFATNRSPVANIASREAENEQIV